ncbi:histidine kinase [Streptomyces sp. WMMC500]|uniref:sensor histidine kinase n=1 Tax=Streptomyces sp. WMMC500 TaxID=3015154 RepID=UPI00248AA5B5|nr:histidine kinase [Streptomyces sp. WMMC500]WBB64239.1 histidine kinase [Streptomyces sp. WMMC500]
MTGTDRLPGTPRRTLPDRLRPGRPDRPDEDRPADDRPHDDREPPGRRRPTTTGTLRRVLRSERAADLLLWLVLSLPVVTAGGLPGAEQVAGLDLSWIRAAAVPLLALAVAVGRHRPLLAAAVPAALALSATPELFTNQFVLAQVALSFLLGRRTDRPRSALLLFGAVAAAGLVLARTVPGATFSGWATLVLTVLFAMVLPWLLGRYARQHAALVGTGWELAERLEREQELTADRTRLRERSRIAGDMHDSLGHELTLIAVRAAALQVAPGLDAAARKEAAELREAAATATEKLREVIGVLREDDEGAPVHPADDRVEELVRRAAASGMRVRLVRDEDRARDAERDARTAEDQPPGGRGDPAPATPAPTTPAPAPTPLPPAADRAIHRVVQEALTNAAKHAPGAPVTVRLRHDADHAEVTVVNGPPPRTTLKDAKEAKAQQTSGGYGLVGLDERVRLAGGTLRAQPVDGGFAVTARLPLAPGAAPAPPREYAARRELAAARRRVRRGILDAIWIPVVGTVVLGVLLFGVDLYTSHRSVLDADTYDTLRIGQSRDTVERRLPAYEADVNTRPPAAPADPPGTDDCLIYRTTPFTLDPSYRLCFTDGRLSHKDKVDADP